jgi:hypothetical protein
MNVSPWAARENREGKVPRERKKEKERSDT